MAEQRERRPIVRRRDGGKSSKVLRHHAHNLERRTVHSHSALEDAGIALKVQGPRTMAEDDGWRAAGLVVGGCQRAAKCGSDPENLEEVPRDERALQPAPLDPGVDLLRSRECIGEDARLAEERFILRPREGSGSTSGSRSRSTANS